MFKVKIRKNKISAGVLAIFAFVIIVGFLFFGNAEKTNASWEDWGMAYSRFVLGSGGINNALGLPNPANIIYDTTSGSTPGTAEKTFNTTCNLSILSPSTWIPCLLSSVLSFVGFLLESAVSLFIWAIDASKLTAILNNAVLYTAWKNVRDLLNIAFILVLLYSAFCTILQIEKYNYKKILLLLVIMALLVNFSFPITRFIIDIANTLQYTILKSLVGDPAKTLAFHTETTMLKDIINPKGNPGLPQLIASIVFVFILAITFLAMGVLFLIRIIALAILIIFSPVAFVGSIISAGSGYAGKWWDNLFRYAFFGPIMVFMLYVATALMSAIGTNELLNRNGAGTFSNIVQQNSIDKDLIVALSSFAIPIVILWLGMGVAQSMSIAGAGAVMGGAQKFIGKVGKYIGKGAYKAPWAAIKATGVPGGVKQAWSKRVTQPLERSRQDKEAFFAGKLGDKSAAERNMKTRAAQYEKDNESLSDLKEWASKGDAAAAYTLATRGKIDQKTFGEAMDKIKDEKTKESLIGKAEDTRMDVTLDYKFKMNAKKATGDPTKKKWTAIQDAAKTEYGNLNAEAWSKQKNLTEQFAPGPHNPYAAEIEAGAKAAFVDLATHSPDGAKEALKRMNGSNAAAIV